MSKRVLIVDDDPAQRRILEETIKRFGFETKTCGSGEQALQILESQDRDPIALVLLDLVMPGVDGMAVLERVGHAQGMPPIIVQTAHGSIETAINAMRRGAVDFVVKPASPERLEVSIKSALKIEALAGEINRIKKKVEGTLTFSDLVMRGETMKRVISLGKRAAASNIPVLIEGESGVGKELIARAVQGESDRVGRPFITVNCGAIPENLVESILFGHEKGSFTGAVDKRIGKFQEADGGTLFLDEVGELPLDAQVKLLRALQEGEIDPIGSKKPVKVNFRLISATNRDMIQLVKDGKFREDLYYRLNVSRSSCRRCASASTTFRSLRVISQPASPPKKESALPQFPNAPWRFCRPIPGPATSASWRTRFSALSCLPTGRSLRLPSSRRSPPTSMVSRRKFRRRRRLCRSSLPTRVRRSSARKTRFPIPSK
jgi:DNA-binding NtrC family response regulator